MNRRSLYTPLYLKFSVPIFLVVVLAAAAITWLIISREEERLRYSLEDKGRTLAQYVSFNSEFGVLTNNQEALQGLVATVLKFRNVVFAEIRDADGKRLARKDAGEELAEDELFTISVPVFTEKTVRKKEEIGLFTEGQVTVSPKPGGSAGEESFLEGEEPVPEAEETRRERIGSVAIGLSRREMNSLLGKARTTGIAITSAAVLVLSLVMAVLVRFVTSPLKVLVDATRRISEGDLAGTMPATSRDEIGELTDSFNRMVANLKRSIDELHQTSDFSQAMIPPKDLDGLLDVILKRFLSLGKVERAWIFLVDEKTGSFILRKKSAGAEAPPDLPKDGILREFLLGAAGVHVLRQEPAWMGRLLAGGVAGLAPLKSKESLVGCIALGGDFTGGSISGEETDLLNTFASIAAMAIENLRLVEIRADNELLKMELRFAHEVQMRLLPQQLPDIQGFRIHPICIPAREIGGDYYDFIYLEGGAKLGISIADVAGKGVPAALYMASSRSLLKAEAAKHEHPGRVLSSINSLLYEDMKDRTFVSMFYGVIDTASRRLEFANAGHLSPILIRQGGEGQTYLKSSGLPLGITSGVRYADTTVDLRPDDVIIFYTDGLIEAMNADKELFGFERLESAVRSLGTHKPQAVVERIMSEVNLFVGGELFSDDLTLIALEVC